MYKAYLVIGGESTGTRLMTRILMKAGCFGDAVHKQRLDTDLTEYVPSACPVVWRRSMPHSGLMPDVANEFISPVVHCDLKESEICVLVMTRNWMCAAMSAVRAGHAHNIGQALANLEQAYLNIFHALDTFPDMPYHMVSYDFLIKGKVVYMNYLMGQLDLKLKGVVTIHDENDKYIWEALDVKRTTTK